MRFGVECEPVGRSGVLEPSVTDGNASRGGRHRRRSTERLLRGVVGAALVTGPLALGGAHAPVNLVLAVALAAALAARVWAQPGRRLELRWPAIAAAGALGLTVLQLVPLPLALLRIVAPKTHEILTMSLGPEAWLAPASLDPPATAHEAVKLVAVVSAAVLGTELFGRRREQLLGWIAASGALVVVVGLAHGILQLDRPYGSFGYARDVFVATFVNPNHLAGYLGFTALAALGLGLAHHGTRRLVLLAVAALGAAGVFLSLSRGGILSLLVGLGFFGAAYGLTRRETRRALLWPQVVLVVGALVAGSLAYTRVVHELWTLGDPDAFAKAELWRPVPRLLADFPVLGIGRGALAAVYPRYVPGGLVATFTHLENEPLQALVDWGLLGGLAVLAGFAAAFVRLLARAPASLPLLGAASGLVLLAVHNLGDFGLELGAVGIAASAVLGAGASDEGPRTTAAASERIRWRWLRCGSVSVPRGAALAVACSLGVLAAGAGAWAARHTIERDSEGLAARLREPGRSETAALAEVQAVVARHPAEYLPPLLFAERLLEQNEPRAALAWINRGMLLAPGFAAGHRLAARALLRLGAREQALLEYRLACGDAPSQTLSIAAEVLAATDEPAAVAALAGEDIDVRRQLASFLLSRRAPAAALTVLVETPESAAGVLAMQARAHLDRRDVAGALVVARRMIDRTPAAAEGYAFAAEALRSQRAVAEALATLEQGLAKAGRAPSLLRMKAVLLLSQGDAEGAREAARSLLEGAGDGPAQADAHGLLGQIYDHEGRRATALQHFQRARDADPRRLSYRLDIARMREMLGDYRAARLELERARVELGSAAELEQAHARVEEREREVQDAARREHLLGSEAPR